MPNIVINTIFIAIIAIIAILVVIIAISITVITVTVATIAVIFFMMSLEVIATSGDLKEYLWTLERNLDADHQFKSLEESYRE